jgi:hypothetical protein
LQCEVRGRGQHYSIHAFVADVMKAGNLKTENPAERDAEQVDSAAPMTTAAVSITQDGQGESRMLGQQNVNYRGRGGWGGGGYPYGGGWGGSPYGGWGELSLVCLLQLCGQGNYRTAVAEVPGPALCGWHQCKTHMLRMSCAVFAQVAAVTAVPKLKLRSGSCAVGD